MSYYCNGAGQNATTHPGCREVGRDCINWREEPAVAGTMGYSQDADHWECIPNEISVTPGGGDDDFGIRDADRALTKGGSTYKGNIDKAMNTVRLSESELVNLIKGVINEQQGPPGPGGYAGGTPCYACILNHTVTMLFPSSALGQPSPDCSPTAYGYQGQQNGLPGGTASYAYPSIWSEVQPTNCGGTNTTYYPCYGCENGQVVASGTSPVSPAQTPLASWVSPGGGGGTLFPAPTGGNNLCATVGTISFYYAPNIPSLPAPLQNCGGNTGSCSKDCSQLVPSNFASKIANKPCKWLSNRENAFTIKLTTLTQGSCQYKRVNCKLEMITDQLTSLGC